MKKISRRNFIGTSAIAAGALGGLAITSKIALNSAILNAFHDEDNFTQWSFGGQAFGNPMVARSMDFRFSFRSVAEKRDYSFRAEVVRACEQLDRKRKGQTIALCHSGGVDSEVIGEVLKEKGIPFELYFLNFWGVNDGTFHDLALPVAKRWGKEVHVVNVSEEEFRAHAVAQFDRLGCEAPTYLGLTYLFSKIPSNQYIVTGDGDLDRHGGLFSHLGKELILGAGDKSLIFPATSVLYENWARLENRPGTFYFYRSTPGLVAATLTNPLYQRSFPFANSKDVIHDAFPQIARREKTTNWEANPTLNHSLRKMLQKHAKAAEYDFWHRLAGTLVQPEKIFRA